MNMIDPKSKQYKPVIGVFDSGVGGLSVLRAIWNELPHADTLYLADQAHVPYGLRPEVEVREYAAGITRYLLEQGAEVIVVACNTASAAALEHLRQTFKYAQFVGMEPAVKPAVEKTNSGVVGVLATPATFQGALYASVVERFAGGVKIIQHTCPGLVEMIEDSCLNSTLARDILEDALQPMLAGGVDTIVLGCTHYPFVIPLIQDIVGPEVRVIDPAPAVARQVRRIAQNQPKDTKDGYAQCLPDTRRPSKEYSTTKDPEKLESMLHFLLKQEGRVVQVYWEDPPAGLVTDNLPRDK
ncbi:glutamate racemase [Chloroflexota bacterium]